MRSKSLLRLAFSCLILLVLCIFILPICQGSLSLTFPLSLLIGGLLVLLFLATICLFLLFFRRRKQEDYAIVANYGSPNNYEKTICLQRRQPIVIKNEPLFYGKLSFNKEAIYCHEKFYLNWQDIDKIVFSYVGICIHTVDLKNKYTSILLPLHENIYYIIKTFFKGEIQGEKHALAVFENNPKFVENKIIVDKNCEYYVFSRKLALVLKVSLAVVSFLAVLLVLSFFINKYNINFNPSIVGVPIMIYILLVIFRRNPLDSLVVGEKGIFYAGGGAILFLAWEKVKSIRQLESVLLFHGDVSFEFPKSEKLLRCLEDAKNRFFLSVNN